ncbi:SAM-dependent methyltransferase [Nocardia pseudobrasiliensis]|uniref:S-adenosyl-L-methionine-dependent methyltransferase n=1 Tax=Nocardia pseudobrasiliensis TaxID=45979 RepID=A0A370IAK4_9NOCA|nr:SAM-dependent methyltransferase [Nocardia pseudobrasiliensis]RDI67735.1 methyltransferase (TIGR00027 family) [Nocardia pseudobrasiliensis]
MFESVSNVPVDGIAVTAIGVAVIRARESERADRLYEDPLAGAFVAAARAGFEAARWEQMLTVADQFYEGRTVGVRLVDDRFREALARGIRQIVLLGAGLDTRAFRMGLPAETAVFEIDLPELFAFKEPVLRQAGAVPTCARHVLIADLGGEWRNALLDGGFRPELPTFWVDEGTLGSLSRDWSRGVVRTLTDLSAAGSLFGTARFVTVPDGEPYRGLRRLVAGASEPAAKIPDGVPEFDAEGWLDDLGWATEFRAWNDMVAPLGRPVAVSDPGTGSIVAVRRSVSRP